MIWKFPRFFPIEVRGLIKLESELSQKFASHRSYKCCHVLFESCQNFSAMPKSHQSVVPFRPTEDCSTVLILLCIEVLTHYVIVNSSIRLKHTT